MYVHYSTKKAPRPIFFERGAIGLAIQLVPQ